MDEHPPKVVFKLYIYNIFKIIFFRNLNIEERFRVALGKFKKLITVTHGITTLEDLRNDIHNAFAKFQIYRNEEFVVQYFNEQFREFIDLDDITELTLLINKTLQIIYIDEMCEFKNDRKAPSY